MNLKNLKKGRNHLLKLAKKGVRFDMRYYMKGDIGLEIYPHSLQAENCGTIGCAMGWMIWAPAFKADRQVCGNYSEAGNFIFDLRDSSNEWDFLFSSAYSEHDNTIEGAIGRLDVILKYPDLFEVQDDT